jgi:L-rhamnonate dehydratase
MRLECRFTSSSAGRPRRASPSYCTGNDIEQFGFKWLKLAIAFGVAEGREGMKKNVDLVKRTRGLLGPEGDIMLDCWMSWNERYTIEMAELVSPHRVYWMEKCLPPYGYEGFGDSGSCWSERRGRSGSRIFTGAAE